MPGKGESSRAARVGERIREELMALVVRGALKDPGAAGAVIHAVEVSGDLSHARVFVRLGDPRATEAQQRGLLRALGRASGHLRRELAGRLGLRHTPELQFTWDDTTERGARIHELLDEIRGELTEAPLDAAPGDEEDSDEP